MIYFYDRLPTNYNINVINGALTLADDFLQLNLEDPLEIRFEENMEYDGYIDEDESDVFITIDSNLSEKELIKTIFHELVHLKQYTTKKFDISSQMWYSNTKVNDCYYERPWELEAFDLERKMYDRYRESQT